MSEEAANQLIGFAIVAAVLWPWPALIAYRKGQAVGMMVLLTIFFYPAALIGAIMMRRDMEVLDARRLAKGEEQKCPHCASFIRREAQVCPHCHRDVPAVA